MNDLENVVRQAESFAVTQAQRAAAGVRRETSLVNAAAQLAGNAQKAIGTAQNAKKSGVYTRDPRTDAVQYMSASSVYATPRSVPNYTVSCPGKPRQGARRTPVQELRTDPKYWRRVALRIVGCVVLAAALTGAVVLILKYWRF